MTPRPTGSVVQSPNSKSFQKRKFQVEILQCLPTTAFLTASLDKELLFDGQTDGKLPNRKCFSFKKQYFSNSSFKKPSHQFEACWAEPFDQPDRSPMQPGDASRIVETDSFKDCTLVRPNLFVHSPLRSSQI